MRVPKASMPMPQQAETRPMVSLLSPCCSSASGTSGIRTPACRPIAPQAANTGSRARRGPAMAGLVGDTEVSFGAEGRRFLHLDGLAFGLGGGLLLAPPHVGIEP